MEGKYDNTGLFRELSKTEQRNFTDWADEHYNTHIREHVMNAPMWHPVVHQRLLERFERTLDKGY